MVGVYICYVVLGFGTGLGVFAFDCVCVVLCFGSLCGLVVALVVWYLACSCKALMFELRLW